MKINTEKLRFENPLKVAFKEQIDGINSIKPVIGTLKLTLLPTGVKITGSIGTILKLTCVRCLNVYFWPLKINIAENLVFNDSSNVFLKDKELLQNDFYELIPDDNVIDLSDIIYQSVILKSPTQNICQEQCSGLSPNTGTNYKPTLTSNNNFDIDPRWLKLKKILPHNND